MKDIKKYNLEELKALAEELKLTVPEKANTKAEISDFIAGTTEYSEWAAAQEKAAAEEKAKAEAAEKAKKDEADKLEALKKTTDDATLLAEAKLLKLSTFKHEGKSYRFTQPDHGVIIFKGVNYTPVSLLEKENKAVLADLVENHPQLFTELFEA